MLPSKTLYSKHFYIFGVRKLKVVDKLVRKKKRTGWLGIPSGISYQREVFPAEVFENLIVTEFCGYQVKIPKVYDEYLKNVYGDYMQIPDVNQREYHVAYKMQL